MKLIEAKGSFREVGRAVGEATREEIAFIRDNTVRDLLASFDGDELRMTRLAMLYHNKSLEIFPEACEYLAGLAEGSAVSARDILFIAFCEELDAEAGASKNSDKCSTLLVRGSSNSWVLGHQEDYWPDYYGKMLVYDLRFEDRPRLVSLNYPGNVPGLAGSLNDAGIAVTNNSLWVKAVPGGFPKQIMHFRATLSNDFIEAMYFLTQEPFVLTDHFTLLSGEQDLAGSIEVSSHSAASRSVEVRQIVSKSFQDEGQVPAPFTHANNVKWLEPWVSGKIPDPAHAGSRMRVRKLDKIALFSPPRDASEMLSLLTKKDGVLNRSEENNLTRQPRSVTLATTVISPGEREVCFVTYGDGNETPRRFRL